MSFFSRLRKHFSKPKRVTHYDKPPKYFGPALIGKAITAAPKPVGSDWIGKRVGG